MSCVRCAPAVSPRARTHAGAADRLTLGAPGAAGWCERNGAGCVRELVTRVAAAVLHQ